MIFPDTIRLLVYDPADRTICERESELLVAELADGFDRYSAASEAIQAGYARLFAGSPELLRAALSVLEHDDELAFTALRVAVAKIMVREVTPA